MPSVTRFTTPDSYLLKLRRSKEHRDAVQRLAKQHIEIRRTGTFMEGEVDQRTGDVWVICPELGFNQSISLAAADCLVNVRACLDHFIGQIAETRGVGVTKQAFPIADRLDDFNESIGKGLLKGVPFEAISIVESHQPYDRTTGMRVDAHPLFVLRELTNTDKHRAVYFASPDVRDLEVTVTAQTETATITAVGPFRPGEPAKLIGTLPFLPRGDSITFVIRGVNRITFEEFPVRGQVVTKVLTEIIDYVEQRVLPPLEGFAKNPG